MKPITFKPACPSDQGSSVRCWHNLAAILIAGLLTGSGCEPSQPSDLDALETTTVQVEDQAFRVWVADNDETRTRGLMKVTAEQMAPLSDGTHRGMIFVFDRDRSSGFWMKDTVIPLDIAFIRKDGVIVSIRTMAPYDTRNYYPDKPYRYALEVRGNLFSELKIGPGDRVEIPEGLLKRGQ